MPVPVGDETDPGRSVRVTISVGVASLNGESRELTDMLAAAEQALEERLKAMCEKLLANTVVEDYRFELEG